MRVEIKKSQEKLLRTTKSACVHWKLLPCMSPQSATHQLFVRIFSKKKIPVAFEIDKRGVSWKELDRQRGGIQRSWWNIQCFMSKATAGEEVEWWGDDGKAGCEERKWVRRHFAGRSHCASEFGSDTRRHKRRQGKSQEGLHRWGVGRCGTKPAGSLSPGFDKVYNQRYQAELTGLHKLFLHMQ